MQSVNHAETRKKAPAWARSSSAAIFGSELVAEFARRINSVHEAQRRIDELAITPAASSARIRSSGKTQLGSRGVARAWNVCERRRAYRSVRRQLVTLANDREVRLGRAGPARACKFACKFAETIDRGHRL